MRVLLCACDSKMQAALAEVSDYLKNKARVEISKNLCKKLDSLPQGKVVIACTDVRKLKRAADEAGVNRFRIRIAELGHGTERAKLAVNAALEKAAAIEIDARSIRINRGKPEVVARIEQEKCSRCSLCVKACPHDAISKEIKINKAKCEACGVCINACQRGAIMLKNYAPEVLDAEMHGLLAKDVSIELRILAFTCAHYLPTNGKLLVVKLPCMGMLSPFLLLRAFDLGCDAALVIVCPEQRCSHGVKPELPRAFVHLAKEIIGALGIDSRRAALFTGGEEQEIDEFVESIAPRDFTSEPTAFENNLPKLLKNLLEKMELKKELILKHDAMPFGMLSVSDKCTFCGVCFNACPANALKMRAEGGKVKLDFSYSECSACMLCEQKCPEKALHIQRVFDLRRFAEDSEITLLEQELIFCRKCGMPFASSKMLERIIKTVQNESLKKAFELCPECRSAAEQV